MVTMKRRALLFDAYSEHKTLASGFTDLRAFEGFLRSNIGGAWESDELFVSKNPKADQVRAAVKAAENTDYTLMFFWGEGGLRKGALPWAEMHASLSSGESITERELNSGSRRCALIFDCGSRMTAQDSNGAFISADEALRHDETSSEFRALFEAEIVAAEGGLTRVYATAAEIGATSQTHSFTQHLLHQSYLWAKTNTGTLYLGDAVMRANEALQQEGSLQRPQYLGGRRLHDFPFAVRII